MSIQLADGINFFSKLNNRKLGNAARLYFSYLYSRLSGKSAISGNPMVLEIEPTTSCNLRCPQCPSGLRQFSRNTGMLEYDFYKQVIDQLEDDLIYLILYFQGEPFLNKNFLDFVRYAASRNIYTATSSNAHYFTDETARAVIESGLDRLIVSIDGISQETYSRYRVGGNLEKVLEGTRNLVKWKKKLNRTTPHIIWQFIAFKHNEHELKELKKMAADLGVDELKIKTAQIYDYAESDILIPENEDLSRYRKTEDGFVIKNRLLNHCWRMWRGSVVTWDGLVVPCCFDKDASHRLGNMSNQSFKEIWNGDQYKQFRQSILKSRKELDICTNCTEGTRVWA